MEHEQAMASWDAWYRTYMLAPEDRDRQAVADLMESRAMYATRGREPSPVADVESLSAAEEFFYAHAGWCHNPRTETSEAGRVRCAWELAEAERRGREAGLTFEWEDDPEGDADGNHPAYACVCRNADGVVVGSLCGIGFADGGDAYSDPYGRVVCAELAMGALPTRQTS